VTPSLVKHRILIVDDDPDILAALSLLLGEQYEVETASNGADAIERLEAVRCDAVLLDLMMPIMDGATLKSEMARRHLDVPIVLTSAGSDLAQRARAIGVEDYITKPLDFDRLESMLAAIVDRQARAARGESAADGAAPTTDAGRGPSRHD